MLSGYKTYIVAGMTVLGCIAGYLTNDMTLIQALNLGIPAILSVTIRHGIANS